MTVIKKLKQTLSQIVLTTAALASFALLTACDNGGNGGNAQPPNQYNCQTQGNCFGSSYGTPSLYGLNYSHVFLGDLNIVNKSKYEDFISYQTFNNGYSSFCDSTIYTIFGDIKLGGCGRYSNTGHIRLLMNSTAAQTDTMVEFIASQLDPWGWNSGIAPLTPYSGRFEPANSNTELIFQNASWLQDSDSLDTGFEVVVSGTDFNSETKSIEIVFRGEVIANGTVYKNRTLYDLQIQNYQIQFFRPNYYY